ncbi:hypothetical protein DDD_1225 [Nonlabens dokdonensis DSW-6]|uniref:Uncharacterized protein n=1 Tax=Nonlabens dokdonensis (strain DSM 17205 / KCTC 12402 / DSW-6) TaxID=592029 RepID=L7W822_NONDD|nr:hypothetical protein DDD_1225 [Nonlabens dokdonensis DSW-6]
MCLKCCNIVCVDLAFAKAELYKQLKYKNCIALRRNLKETSCLKKY